MSWVFGFLEYRNLVLLERFENFLLRIKIYEVVWYVFFKGVKVIIKYF